MHSFLHVWLARSLFPLALLWPPGAIAQDEFRQDERLDDKRPEAWAMNYFTSTTLMTAFGEAPNLHAGEWTVAAELGEVPHLDASQRTVGFNGFKNEDLNKTPAFGRARLQLGLPAGWVLEAGYTPPVTINGLRARDLVAIAVGRRIVERERFSLSGRVFGQHGSASGDITCPAGLAGLQDIEKNPYGCESPSDDRVRLNYYGLDLTPSWSRGAWQWHATMGMVRTEPEVEVDALTYGVRDRSRLVTRDALPYLAIGTSRPLGARWQAGLEVLHVALRVQRSSERNTESDPLTSLRLRLVYRPHGP